MLAEPEQQAVIRGLRDGCRTAWAALYNGYSTDLWRFVGRLLGGQSSDIADVVQETFLTAAREARQFDPARGSLWSWLAGIAHHRAAALWRQAERTSRLRERLEAGTLCLPQWGADSEAADEIWERRELAELVRELFAELSADYAALLTAKYLDEQSLDEMAVRFSGSVEAIKSKLARARREFREAFEGRTQEPVAARVVRDGQT